MTIVLRSPRLTLRPFQSSDAERVQVLANDKEIASMTLAIPYPYTIQDARSWLELHPPLMERGDAYPFAVVAGEEIIGTVTIRIDKQHRKGELAYYIGKAYRGKGYATEAVKRVIDFGFNEINLNRIWAPIMSKNRASAAVLKKAGLAYEGTLKQDVYKWGQYEDVDIFGIMRDN